MTDPRDHEDLERLVRDGLERRASDADTSAPVVDRARAAVRRRRAGRVAAGVAGSAVAAVAVTGVVLQQTGPAITQPLPLATDNPSASAPATAGGDWRTESWHGVMVDVPAAWGWGAAPRSLDGNQDEIFFCGGPGAMVTGAGERLANPEATLPYVGRPIMLSDLCTGGQADDAPVAPYVWFDAEGLDPGSEELGEGYVRVTVEMAGSTVTVASPDAAVRQRVLDSVRPVEGCDAALPGSPRVGGTSPTDEMTKVGSALVCAYERAGDRGFDLVYAATVTSDQAQALHDATVAAPPPPQRCAGGTADEYVAITTEGRDQTGGRVRDVAIATLAGDCSRIDTMGGTSYELTPANERPWARGGIQVVLRHFIGMLG